ncbi:hypothetical protein Hanom_Chr12g01071831 [Helianthus anomalus]
MSPVTEISGRWSFKSNADRYNDGNEGGYEYAPAASENNGDDDDGDYDYAPAA